MSTNPAFRNDPTGFFAIALGTQDAMRIGGASGDNSGQLAGFRNILINGKLNLNTRGVTIAAAAIGAYGPDRWKKVDASNMTQIVEDGNYKPSSIYTLSGVGVTTQQINSPASGHWTMPSIPISASYIQCELGAIATQFELRPIGFERSLCVWYCQPLSPLVSQNYTLLGAATTTYTAICTKSIQPMRGAITLYATGTWGATSVSASGTVGSVILTGYSAETITVTIGMTAGVWGVGSVILASGQGYLESEL